MFSGASCVNVDNRSNAEPDLDIASLVESVRKLFESQAQAMGDLLEQIERVLDDLESSPEEVDRSEATGRLADYLNTVALGAADSGE